jgi:SAM-dependent methyltransferase
MRYQQKQNDWAWEWEHYDGEDEWLFHDWIKPNTIEDFRDKRVLDAGCGSGQHLSIVAPYAREAIGVDLNASDIAKRRNANNTNVSIIEGDIAAISFPSPFDVVYCIGVIHHTNDPDCTFANLARLTAPGGRTIVWTYSYEGNYLNRTLVEGGKRLFVSHLPKPSIKLLSIILTALIYIPVYTIYVLPLRFLPYYEYFQNWRKLTWNSNELNVFDKLNAPTTHFITKDRITRWFESNGYRDISITPYRGVSWRGSGTKMQLVAGSWQLYE